MLLFEQLDLFFARPGPQVARGRDKNLEASARVLLLPLGSAPVAKKVRVEWNPRLRSAAGRADTRRQLITLNPLLQDQGAAEIDRTLRHELAHLLAQFRAGRRRVQPHGPQWRAACCDLGIPGESRCHNLPFPSICAVPRLIYQCSRCRREFLRVRRLRRPVACLACCRRYYGGNYTQRYQLRLAERDIDGNISRPIR